jgi:gliding motility-associated-like protein
MLHSTYEAGPVVVSATQAAIPGYSSATAEAYITINRGIPTIVFTNQGGIVEDTLKLVFSSNSEGYHYFNSVGSGDVYEFYGEDHVVIIGVGESKIGLYYYSSQDYEEGYAEAIIFGYTALVAPVANNDQAELIYGQQETIKFNVLSNDEAYTGAIVSSKVDLDPGTAGIQSVYVSPSLGLFEADTNGEITYTPFSGFIGSGQITYTITDTKGISSKPANISVAVILQGEAPALKATELITPNNDGLNDAFVIGYVDLEKENILKIYDRTGAELYSKTNYSNDWKGELSNGNAVEDGVYFFLFVEEGNGRKRELKGAIEVKR